MCDLIMRMKHGDNIDAVVGSSTGSNLNANTDHIKKGSYIT